MLLQAPLETITASVDGEVLQVLASTTQKYSLAQLSLLLSHRSRPGIRKSLRRLEEQGVVLRERIGNADSYQLNRNHLAAEPIIALAQMRNELLRRIEERLQAMTFPPLYAVLYGSAARSSMTVFSDLDIFLLRQELTEDEAESWEEEIALLEKDIYAWTGNPSEFISYSPDEVSTIRDATLFESVLREGITIMGDKRALKEALKP